MKKAASRNASPEDREKAPGGDVSAASVNLGTRPTRSETAGPPKPSGDLCVPMRTFRLAKGNYTGNADCSWAVGGHYTDGASLNGIITRMWLDGDCNVVFFEIRETKKPESLYRGTAMVFVGAGETGAFLEKQ